MARAGSMNAPGPFNFRGCGLTAECLLAREMVRVRFPAAAPIFLQAARQHAAESPKLNLLRAARRQPAIFIWGRGRQAMHLPCKQGYVGALPTDSTSLRSKRSESEGCRAEAERRLPRRSGAKAGHTARQHRCASSY